MSNRTILSRWLFRLAVLFAFLWPGSPLHAADGSVFIDKGACPFECCTYGTWTVTATTQLLAAPSDRTAVARVYRGQKVRAVTGEVHTVPGRFIVKKRHGAYKKGDVIFVYTYLGEGYFRVRYRGRVYEEDLGFSPHGGSAGDRCQNDSICFGELESKYQSTWWIEIQSPSGQTGWTDRADNFSGKDSCG